ncbi:MAG: NAD(P)(+) transhydrogenase (Re/Si-specific) subunit beta [Bryobacteraceae bacterium]|nr:NAD(P)(+) transhydrogenase (Re/Si-specific) subunit beta [Bryobacteraceae bacterium]MDW8379265.1 NAD(P)(+) transhydrogenase (Re/Si-specific) subunit beta [Bryobacterales bacterium]
MSPQAFWQISYLIAAILITLSIKWLNSPTTARRGVRAGQIGMLFAVVGTLLRHEVVSYEWIVVGMVVGSAIGAPLAFLMPMTAVPQLTALSHAFGALAAALVGTAEYYQHQPHGFRMFALVVETLLGYLTFTASVMAFAKLQELVPTRPVTYRGQNVVNLSLLGIAVALGAWTIEGSAPGWAFPAFSLLALLFGVLLIIPIGGGDMPTVIALLNSYAGMAAAAMGFALNNKLLIIAGALNAASGFILSVLMCKAMNRSFTNVLFGAFGQAQEGSTTAAQQRPVRSASPEDAAAILAAARKVIVVPGYGMAVAQAQHKIRELTDQLVKRGVDVQFAIHPVAGRMPGHMNVLLAEADISYERLHEMEEINSEFSEADVALVIGANDVVNPAARHDTSSPIYGMPILDVDKAQTVMVIKRSLNPGFAGIDNELYYSDRTLMLFGDAKQFVAEIVKQLPKVA